MLIHIKCFYTILGKIHFGSDAAELRFSVPIEDSSLVTIEILPSQNRVEASYAVEVSEEMLNFLKTGSLELPSTLEDELGRIMTFSHLAAKKVLYLVKYGLNCISLDERLIASTGAQWSIDKAVWKILPRRIKASFDAYSIHNLDADTAPIIQQWIQNGFEPFLALRHLHKAREENIPHYKWIDATIAAELAIKEFLIRLKPEIATLLLEVPSPPLHKLYGVVLESLGLPKSPKVSQIAKGVEIRNKLVHRLDQATTYVKDIEIAIHHLLTLLYPNDSNVRYFFSAAALESES